MFQITWKFMNLIFVAHLIMAGAPGSAQSWSSAGFLGETRSSHSQVLLNNGKVLVVGGQNGSDATASAEIYDPATNGWSPAASMAIPHGASPAGPAVLLLNGKVLVAGGIYATTPTSKVEIYDPALNIWTEVASLSTPRWDHTTTLLADGRVLVAGGQFGYGCNTTATAELYDPMTDTWASTGSMAQAREGFMAVRLQDGRVLATYGDASCASAAFQTVELYDPETGMWSQGAPLLYPHRGSYALTLLPNGKVLASGTGTNSNYDKKTEIYDPILDQWTFAGDLSQSRGSLVATLLGNGKVLVTGGMNQTQAFATCELFDPASLAWSLTTPMSVGRGAHSATLLPNGKVLVSGGDKWGGLLASAELYEPPSPYKASVQPPINLDGSSVFKANRSAIPIKFALTVEEMPTCNLPAARIEVARVSGSASGQVNESDLQMPSDSGSNFRVSDCQYVYVLNAASLGAGTYVVKIRIDSAVVGTATFSMK